MIKMCPCFEIVYYRFLLRVKTYQNSIGKLWLFENKKIDQLQNLASTKYLILHTGNFALFKGFFAYHKINQIKKNATKLTLLYLGIKTGSAKVSVRLASKAPYATMVPSTEVSVLVSNEHLFKNKEHGFFFVSYVIEMVVVEL